MYLSEGSMQSIIYGIADVLEIPLDMDIERVSGVPVPLNEDEDTCEKRVRDAMRDIESGLSDPDEHCIVVTHRDVMITAAKMYQAKETDIYDVQDCAFMCVAATKDESSWVFAKSRMHAVVP